MIIKKALLHYSLKIWITSICLAPLLMVLSDIKNNVDAGSAKTLLLSSMIFIIFEIATSFLYFIPSFLVYTLTLLKLRQLRITHGVIRLILTLLALTTMFITVYIAQGKHAFMTNNFFGVNFSFFQAISISITGYIYKMPTLV